MYAYEYILLNNKNIFIFVKNHVWINKNQTLNKLGNRVKIYKLS